MIEAAPSRLRTRLSAMLLLNFAVPATYYPLLAKYLERDLGLSPDQLAYVFMATPIAMLVAPILMGWIADRYLPAEKLLSACSLLRTGVLFGMAWTDSFEMFLAGMIVNAVLLGGSMVSTYAIAFHHLPDARGYGRVRVWGAVSWMATLWAVSAYLRRLEIAGTPQMRHMFLFGAGLSLMLGVYALTLPRTAPSQDSQKRLAFGGAFGLLKRRGFAVLAIAMVISAASSPFNFMLRPLLFTDSATGLGLEVSQTNLASSVSQFPELILYPLLGAIIARFGLRAVIFIGLAAWPLRFGAYMAGDPAWLVIACGFALWKAVISRCVSIQITSKSTPPSVSSGLPVPQAWKSRMA